MNPESQYTPKSNGRTSNLTTLSIHVPIMWGVTKVGASQPTAFEAVYRYMPQLWCQSLVQTSHDPSQPFESTISKLHGQGSAESDQ